MTPGTWLALSGPLGSGKTVLARGVLGGLGYEGPVRSPTYTVLQAYEGGTRIPAYHVDLYRLADPGEIWELGLFDLCSDPVVVIIEWADRLASCELPDHLAIAFDFGDERQERRLAWTAQGEDMRQILARLVRAGAVSPC